MSNPTTEVKKAFWPYEYDCEECLSEGVSQDDGTTICVECAGTGSVYHAPCTVVDAIMSTYLAAEREACERVLLNRAAYYNEQHRISGEDVDANMRDECELMAQRIRALAMRASGHVLNKGAK